MAFPVMETFSMGMIPQQQGIVCSSEFKIPPPPPPLKRGGPTKPRARNRKASPFRLRFGAPRTRFWAVKPPSLRSSIPARVTYFCLVFVWPLLPPSSPPAGECIQILIFIATFSPRIWV
ncbi:hypothetical protein TNCV_4081091 [Trichonephila clavipes]|nr:hypothetical protein TNCV_4081091 [Trichonephila clavipes]